MYTIAMYTNYFVLFDLYLKILSITGTVRILEKVLRTLGISLIY